MNISIDKFILLTTFLFLISCIGILVRRNVIVILMCLELMLNSINILLVAFSRYNNIMDGNLFVFFIIAVAAAEAVIGLAIIVAIFKKKKSVIV